jgi:hypothetical protein
MDANNAWCNVKVTAIENSSRLATIRIGQIYQGEPFDLIHVLDLTLGLSLEAKIELMSECT